MISSLSDQICYDQHTKQKKHSNSALQNRITPQFNSVNNKTQTKQRTSHDKANTNQIHYRWNHWMQWSTKFKFLNMGIKPKSYRIHWPGNKIKNSGKPNKIKAIIQFRSKIHAEESRLTSHQLKKQRALSIHRLVFPPSLPNKTHTH